MPHEDFSRVNSHKLDRLLVLVEGSQDSPGVLARLALIERVLFGKDNAGGLLQEHQRLWRLHIWLIGLASTGAGALIGLLLQKIFNFKL